MPKMTMHKELDLVREEVEFFRKQKAAEMKNEQEAKQQKIAKPKENKGQR